MRVTFQIRTSKKNMIPKENKARKKKKREVESTHENRWHVENEDSTEIKLSLGGSI